jgi:hypothetical protein
MSATMPANDRGERKPVRRTHSVAAAAAVLALLSAAGCASVNAVFQPGGIQGQARPGHGQIKLQEKACPPMAESHGTATAYRTMDAPVLLDVKDRNMDFSVIVILSGLLDTPNIPGTFAGGKIVQREFGRFVEGNFRFPSVGEEPAAKLSVSLHAVENIQMTGKDMETSLRLHVEVAKPDGATPVYSQTFIASASAPWNDRTLVPDSFYLALFEAISKFKEDWDRSDGPGAVERWAKGAAPGATPPELRAIDWEPRGRENGVQRGRCTVACNGWEPFRTKHWANAQIAVACRTKLGNIEPERVRVVYPDGIGEKGEAFDPASGMWTFSFRCFARSEMVLDFNSATGTGVVIGDLGLMNTDAEKAAPLLRKYVHEEMDSHAGMVTGKRPGTEARLRFDDFTTDPTYNLVSITFRLLR